MKIPRLSRWVIPSPIGSRWGRAVFTLQTLRACNTEDELSGTPGQVAEFSLHTANRCELVAVGCGGMSPNERTLH